MTAAAATATDRWVQVGTKRIRTTIRTGNGTRPPLLLCGGIGAGYEMLQPLVDALDPAIEIIRVDVPGVGGSPLAALTQGFPAHAYLLAQVLDRLGYRQVDLLGYSWGGGLAQQFAIQHPGYCRRLVLVSTSTGAVSIPGRPVGLAELPAARQSISGAYTTGLGVLQQLTAVASWTSLTFLPLIGQDVLVMSGEDDPIVPLLNARIMAGLIPNAQLHIFPGGHFEIVTAPTSLAPRLDRFLAKAHHTS